MSDSMRTDAVVESRADQIFERFRAFHLANPVIWELFDRFALELVARGRRRYSAKAIFERIRWHLDVETDGQVKLNNDFTAYYARMWRQKHPEHADMMQTRLQTSASRLACREDVAVWDLGPPSPVREAIVAERMREKRR